MKKLMMLMVFLASAVLTFSATKGSEKPIPFEKLPKMAQEFIHTHFKGVKVVKCEVESPWTQFDVRMANGYELEFDRAGNWIEVQKEKGSISLSILGILPQRSYSYLQSNYSGVSVEKIERQKKGFKVSLNTQPEETEMHFSKDGRFLSKKVD